MNNFKYTPEQQKIADYIIEQVSLRDKGKNVIVSGIGGTGKTTMICQVIVQLLKLNYKVAVGTITGKATNVLRRKIQDTLNAEGLSYKETELKIETLAKLTKKTHIIGNNAKGQTFYNSQWINPKSFKYDALVIDELSMVPSYLSQWWNLTKCRVIGLGDYCQIPEVDTEDKTEPNSLKRDLKIQGEYNIPHYGVKVLKNLAQFEMKEVLRSVGDITKLCNDLRDFSLNKNQIKSLIKGWSNKSSSIQYSTQMKDLEAGEDWQIITYTNKLSQEINDMLAIRKEYPDDEDKILLFDNINPINCYNGEVYKFKSLQEIVRNYNSAHPSSPIYIVWKFNGVMPRQRSPYVTEKVSYLNYIRYKREVKSLAQKRNKMIKDIISKETRLTPEEKYNYLSGIDNILNSCMDEKDTFTEIIAFIEDKNYNLARNIVSAVPSDPNVFFVNIGLGYSCTTHKSQGSEYDKVCYILEKMDKPLLYTGCSRAKKQLKVIDLT